MKKVIFKNKDGHIFNEREFNNQNEINDFIKKEYDAHEDKNSISHEIIDLTDERAEKLAERASVKALKDKETLSNADVKKILKYLIEKNIA